MDFDVPGAERRRLPAYAPLLALGVALAAVISAFFAVRAFTGWRSERAAAGSLAAIAENKRRTAGATPSADGDDLTVVEGIGPRLESALKTAGITTYRQLADSRPGRLETIMREAHVRMANPSTWPEQATLAADGRWQELQELQQRLKSGKRMQ